MTSSQISVGRKAVVICVDDRYSTGCLHQALGGENFFQFTRVGGPRHLMNHEHSRRLLLEEIEDLRVVGVRITELTLVNHYSDEPGNGCKAAGSASRVLQTECLAKTCHTLRMLRELDQITFRLLLHNNDNNSVHELELPIRHRRSEWPDHADHHPKRVQERTANPCVIASTP